MDNKKTRGHALCMWFAEYILYDNEISNKITNTNNQCMHHDLACLPTL